MQLLDVWWSYWKSGISSWGKILIRGDSEGIESESQVGWKRPWRSSHPVITPGLLIPPLNHITKVLIYTFFECFQGPTNTSRIHGLWMEVPLASAFCMYTKHPQKGPFLISGVISDCIICSPLQDGYYFSSHKLDFCSWTFYSMGQAYTMYNVKTIGHTFTMGSGHSLWTTVHRLL